MGFFTKRGRTQFFRDEQTGEVKGTRYYSDNDIDTKAMGKGFDEQKEPYPIKKGHAGKSEADVELDKLVEEMEQKEKMGRKREKIKKKQKNVEEKRKHELKKLEGKRKLTQSRADLKKAKVDLKTARRQNLHETLSPITGNLGSAKGHAMSLKEMVGESHFLGGEGESKSSGTRVRESIFDFGINDRFDFGSASKRSGNEIDFGAKKGGIFDIGTSNKKDNMFSYGSNKQDYDIGLGKVDFGLAIGSGTPIKKKRKVSKKKKKTIKRKKAGTKKSARRKKGKKKK